MKRGEIWWANLAAPAGRRPVVLLSRNEAYALREFITIAPVTSRVRKLLAEVPLGPGDGLPRSCVANLDNIVTIAKARLTDRITKLSAEKMAAVEEAIRFSLGFGEE